MQVLIRPRTFGRKDESAVVALDKHGSVAVNKFFEFGREEVGVGSGKKLPSLLAITLR